MYNKTTTCGVSNISQGFRKQQTFFRRVPYEVEEKVEEGTEGQKLNQVEAQQIVAHFFDKNILATGREK